MAAKATPDPTGKEFYELCVQQANQLAKCIDQGSRTYPTSTVIERLLRRMMDSANAIAHLHLNATQDFGFDIAMILRGMYDVMLQGLYIIEDPAKSSERAQLFLDYASVERYRKIQRIDKNQTGLAKKLANSTRRPEAMPRIEAEFQRVKPRYLTKKGDKLREHWFPGNLSVLAKATGWESEYELFQELLSSMVHSSPMAMEQESSINGGVLLTWSWYFALRLAFKYAKVCNAPLTEELRGASANWFVNLLDAPEESIGQQ